MSEPLPSVFVSHGAPTIVIEDNASRRFLAGLGAALPRPRAIVVVSGHWECARPAVLSSLRPPTIHDFYGFPEALYALHYPAPGAPSVARRIEQLCAVADIPLISDPARGLDHGAWIPLQLMYPEHDIPVTQLAVCPNHDAAYHWRLGRALAPLREEGVLILGSGSMTHNLGDVRGLHRGGSVPPLDYAGDFSAWMAAAIEAGDTEALLAWRERAPHAQRAHPSEEHLLPLHVCAGAAGEDWHGRRLHHEILLGAIAMDAYRFEPALRRAA
jgi:4,5-DOPA dioxygenase extradiol